MPRRGSTRCRHVQPNRLLASSRPLLSVVSFRAQCEVECQVEFAAGGYDASALSEEQQRALRVGHHAWEQPS